MVEVVVVVVVMVMMMMISCKLARMTCLHAPAAAASNLSTYLAGGGGGDGGKWSAHSATAGFLASGGADAALSVITPVIFVETVITYVSC